MNIAHGKTKLKLVRHALLCCVLGCASLSAAHAGDKERDRDERRAAAEQRDRQPQREGNRERFDNRAFEAREEQRRQAQMQQDRNQNDALRRGGRMTPDERRDLRRQINEANLDLYPNTPRR